MRDSIKKLSEDIDKLMKRLKAGTESKKSEQHNYVGSTTEPPPKIK